MQTENIQEVVVVGRRRTSETTVMIQFGGPVVNPLILGARPPITGPPPLGEILKPGEIVKPGFRTLGDLFRNGRIPTKQELIEFAKSQGWKPEQSPTGPLKFRDENGVARMTIKNGSSRTPGSENPHAAFRNAEDQRIDPFGNLTSRKNPDNHYPISINSTAEYIL